MHHELLILKHPLRVRMFHYLLMISFLPLAATGVILYFKPFGESAMNLAMQIHAAAGALLALAAGAFFLLAFDRVLLFVKRIFTFSLDDVRWFAVLGGYPQKLLLGRKISVPPMGKYNSGQKLFGICVLIGGAVLIVSGLALWAFPHLLPRAATAYLGLLHTFFGWLLTLFLPVHLFLGVYMADDFKAMILHGRIPLAEAGEMSPRWVEKEIIPLSENR